jgi:inorganic pyrophosphatase
MISHFFETYKTLEGKETATEGWRDGAAARRSIVESRDRFVAHESELAPQVDDITI